MVALVRVIMHERSAKEKCWAKTSNASYPWGYSPHRNTRSLKALLLQAFEESNTVQCDASEGWWEGGKQAHLHDAQTPAFGMKTTLSLTCGASNADGTGVPSSAMVKGEYPRSTMNSLI